MNRLGFRHDNLDRTLPEVAASANLAVDAVYTHFATADAPDHPAFAEQRVRFDDVCARLPALGIPVRARHAANSAALLRDERVWYDFVRPGPAALRRRAAAAGRDDSAATCPVTPQSYRGGEGPPPRRGHGLWLARRRRCGPDDRRRAGRLCRWPRPSARRPRPHARARPPRTGRRLGVHGHVDDRRHRHGRRARRRSRHRRRAGSGG